MSQNLAPAFLRNKTKPPFEVNSVQRKAVTFCDITDKPAWHWLYIVGDMNKLMTHLTSVLVLSPLACADLLAEPVQLRYGQTSSTINISVVTDISVDDHENIAGRTLSMGLDYNPENIEKTVTIEKVKAVFKAHDMSQRLPTRELTGQTLNLVKINSDRQLGISEPENG